MTIPAALLAQQQRTQTIFTYVMVAIRRRRLRGRGRSGSGRSIGARRMDIVQQFLTESVMISVGGGLLGIAFGYFLAELIARTAERKTVVTTASVVIAFGVSVFVGVVFGVYPGGEGVADQCDRRVAV